MRALLALLVVVMLALAFYAAWPAWAAYRIYTAILAKDADGLERGIDFASVRMSLRKPASEKLAELYVSPQAGPSNPLLVERLKQQAVSGMVVGALESLVTPGNLILLTSEGGPLKDSIERMLRDQMSRGGQVSGTTGAAGAGAAKRGPVFRTVTSEATAPAPSYGLGNVKHVRFLGPLSYEIGIAKSAAAKGAEVRVELSFTGTDWRVTAVGPAP
jgi:hypothetical protein